MLMIVGANIMDFVLSVKYTVA